MKGDTILLTLAFMVVIISIGGTIFTYSFIENFKNTWLTGFATGGTVNFTVESIVSINFTNDTINFGSGRVNIGSTRAELLTTGPTGTITNGNWTADTGFIVENIGNINVTVDIASGKTPATFVGGTNPGYLWNVTAFNAANVGATCLNNSGGVQAGGGVHELGFFYTVNTSGVRFCANFSFVDAFDTLRIDFNITVPEDSTKGALSDSITMTIAAG